jgi:hypothetical protein
MPSLTMGRPGTDAFPLLASSPAIDHGNYSICTSDPSLATDQVGLPTNEMPVILAPRNSFPIVRMTL